MTRKRFRQQSGQSIGGPVTPDAQMSEPALPTLLLCGVDTLDVGVFVVWPNWPNLVQKLRQAKARANQSKADAASLDVGIDNLVAAPTGKPPNYQYRLYTADYELCIADRPDWSNYPNVWMSPRARVLQERGVSGTIERLARDLENLGATVEGFQPSRVDIFADFRLPRGLDQRWLDYHRVSQSGSASIEAQHSELQTYHVARGSKTVQLRIYDKTTEAQNHGKHWMWSLWGVEPDAEVWRVEFQLGREWLRQFEINTPEALRHRLQPIWAYLTDNWFSLRQHDNQHTTRRSPCEFWRAVQSVASELPGSAQLARNLNESTPNLDQLIAQIRGYLASFAARRQVDTLEDAILAFLLDLLALGRDQDFAETVRHRAIRFGTPIRNSKRR